METIYNSMKGPRLFKRGSLSRFGVIMLINIYRVFIYKISFPDKITNNSAATCIMQTSFFVTMKWALNVMARGDNSIDRAHHFHRWNDSEGWRLAESEK